MLLRAHLTQRVPEPSALIATASVQGLVRSLTLIEQHCILKAMRAGALTKHGRWSASNLSFSNELWHERITSNDAHSSRMRRGNALSRPLCTCMKRLDQHTPASARLLNRRESSGSPCTVISLMSRASSPLAPVIIWPPILFLTHRPGCIMLIQRRA